LAELRRIRYYCVQFCSVVCDKIIGYYFVLQETGKMHIIPIIYGCLVQYFYVMVLVYLCLLCVLQDKIFTCEC